MHILFVTTAHNSLSQRLAVELTERGHAIAVCLATSGERVIEAADRERPDLIVAPMMDAGPIWSSRTFRMPARPVSKSSLYRAEVTEAAVSAVLEAVARFESGQFVPEALDYARADVTGSLRPSMKQRDRAIDWQHDTTSDIARKVRAADSNPGVLTTLCGQEVSVYGAHEEEDLTGLPGQVIGQRNGAICIGTVDGAVWITHAKLRTAGIKLPAMHVFRDLRPTVPQLDLHPTHPADYRSWREIAYREQGEVGYTSEYAFSRAFARHRGQPPGRYRRRASQNDGPMTRRNP